MPQKFFVNQFKQDISQCKIAIHRYFRKIPQFFGNVIYVHSALSKIKFKGLAPVYTTIYMHEFKKFLKVK